MPGEVWQEVGHGMGAASVILVLDYVVKFTVE